MRQKRRLGLCLLLLAAFAPTADAEGVGASRLPKSRPALVQPVVDTSPSIAPDAGQDEAIAAENGALILHLPHRPRPRPEGLGVPVAADEAFPTPEKVQLASAVITPILRPRPRPDGLADASQAAADTPAPKGKKGKGWGIFRASARAPQGDTLVMPRKGSVCGNPAIRGETIPPVQSRVKGCGIDDPVKVTSVSGISLSQPAEIDCDTAIALNQWVNDGLKPAFGRTEVVQLLIAGSYACRPRNNQRGNKISEHGRGKAVDIEGFVLANGARITVARNWRHDYSKPIKAAHRAACGIFGTTLGPGSDGHHEDHMHFDTAAHRSGAYCH